MRHFEMFVTPKVFKFIGPYNDCRRHGRGTYLFICETGTGIKSREEPFCSYFGALSIDHSS
jgi:hypothetical protein